MSHFVIAALASASLALAQQAPDAGELFGTCVKALGGAERQRAVTTRVLTGTVEISDDGSSSKVEIMAKAPNLYSLVVVSPVNAVSRTVFAGTAGWFSDPDSGVRAMSSADLAVYASEFDFHRALHLAELYPVRESPRQAVLSGKPVWVVDAKTPSGAPEKLSFDAATGVLVSREYERVSMEDGITNFQEFYEDYRDVGGIQNALPDSPCDTGLPSDVPVLEHPAQRTGGRCRVREAVQVAPFSAATPA